MPLPRAIRNFGKIPSRTAGSLQRRLDPDHRLAWALDRFDPTRHRPVTPPPSRPRVDLPDTLAHHPPRLDRRVLILGWYGNETTGDQAILGGILRRLDPAGVVLATSDRDVSRATLAALGAESATLIDDTPASVAASLPGVEAVILGGGPLKEGPMLAAWADAFELARSSGAGRMVYGCGIGPIKSPRSARQLRRLLSLCDIATVRDAGSRDLARRLGADVSATHVAADPAVAFDWQDGPLQHHASQPDAPHHASDHEPATTPRCGVGISFRYLARDYHRGPGSAPRTEAAAFGAYIQFINHLHATTDRRAWLVPMQLEGSRNDRLLLSQLRDRLDQPGRATMLDYDGPADLVRRLARLEARGGHALPQPRARLARGHPRGRDRLRHARRQGHGHHAPDERRRPAAAPGRPHRTAPHRPLRHALAGAGSPARDAA